VLDVPQERYFSSMDVGIAGYKARHNLAIVCEEMGELAEAEAEWRLGLDEVPTYRPAWRGLSEVLLRQGKLDETEELARRLREDPDLDQSCLRCEGLLIEARMARARGNLPEAQHCLKTAYRRFSDDLPALQAFAQFLFEQGDPLEAEVVLRTLAGKQPEDASVCHNLGTLYLRLKRYGDAARWCERSLRLRPDSAPTCLHLGYALRELGRFGEAESALIAAARLAPADDAARAALHELGQHRTQIDTMNSTNSV
jgi:tetratricopeptide (TPR) repeat protein